jgi:FMN reductase
MPAHPHQSLIVGLGGTLRDHSYSRVTLKEALRVAEAQGATTELLDLYELDLPMFRPNVPIDGYREEHRAGLTRLIDAVRRANGMIWSSPTYHGTVSGVFKNALDHLDLMDRDEPPYLQGRVVGLMALTDRHTIQTMLSSAYELRAWVAPTQILFSVHEDFDEPLAVKEGRATRRIARMVSEMMDFMERRK